MAACYAVIWKYNNLEQKSIDIQILPLYQEPPEPLIMNKKRFHATLFGKMDLLIPLDLLLGRMKARDRVLYLSDLKKKFR